MVELVVQDFEKNKQCYETAKQKLQIALGENIDIHHVGSTAIPNIVGKNIIDILVGAENKTQFEELYQKITNLGFFASQNSKTDIYTFFCIFPNRNNIRRCSYSFGYQKHTKI